MIHDSVISAGTPTPIVRLSPRSTRGLQCEVLVKLESSLPSGTSSDRVAMELIKEAISQARADQGSTLVLAGHSGNIALSLAVAAAVSGYRLIVALPDRVSEEKIQVMKALGAKIHLCPATATREHPDSFFATAERLSREIPGAILVDPNCSEAGPATHARTTAEEILEQTEGRLDILLAPLESGSTITGLARVLKKKIPGLKVVGAEPEGALYHDFWKFGRVGTPGTTLVEGAGSDHIAGTLEVALLDGVIQVSDPEALRMARRLARNEGILTGSAGGLCVAAALKSAPTLQDGKRILAILPDTGLYYVNRIYNESWMQANQILGGAADRTLFDVLAAKQDDPGSLQSITPDEPLREAISRMKRHQISQLPVITRDGAPVGSLWEGMVIDLVIQGKDTHKMMVREVMAEPFPIMEMETPVVEVTRYFGPRVSAILVRRREGDFAIITKHDLLQGLTS